MCAQVKTYGLLSLLAVALMAAPSSAQIDVAVQGTAVANASVNDGDFDGLGDGKGFVDSFAPPTGQQTRFNRIAVHVFKLPDRSSISGLSGTAELTAAKISAFLNANTATAEIGNLDAIALAVRADSQIINSDYEDSRAKLGGPDVIADDWATPATPAGNAALPDIVDGALLTYLKNNYLDDGFLFISLVTEQVPAGDVDPDPRYRIRGMTSSPIALELIYTGMPVQVAESKSVTLDPAPAVANASVNDGDFDGFGNGKGFVDSFAPPTGQQTTFNRIAVHVFKLPDRDNISGLSGTGELTAAKISAFLNANTATAEIGNLDAIALAVRADSQIINSDYEDSRAKLGGPDVIADDWATPATQAGNAALPDIVDGTLLTYLKDNYLDDGFLFVSLVTERVPAGDVDPDPRYRVRGMTSSPITLQLSFTGTAGVGGEPAKIVKFGRDNAAGLNNLDGRRIGGTVTADGLTLTVLDFTRPDFYDVSATDGDGIFEPQVRDPAAFIGTSGSDGGFWAINVSGVHNAGFADLVGGTDINKSEAQCLSPLESITFDFDHPVSFTEIITVGLSAGEELTITAGETVALLTADATGRGLTTFSRETLGALNGLTLKAGTDVTFAFDTADPLARDDGDNTNNNSPAMAFRTFTVEVGTQPEAFRPSPADGAAAVSPDVVLSWAPGELANTHDVYLGTDVDSVTNADGTDSLGVLVSKGQDPNGYTPAESLPLGQTHYWRIDEVKADGSVAKGDVWSFTVAEYLQVDDMESYGDANTPGQPGSRIWYTWTDGEGWVVPAPGAGGNGSGSLTDLGTETRLGGEHSLWFHYDNDGTNVLGTGGKAYYSELRANTDNLAIGKDWTKAGVKALSLSFYGQPDNAITEQLYVKLNGVKVLYDGLGNVAQPWWHEWNIDLAAFTGVDLTNITQMAIGFGDENATAPGGSGMVLFDNIRLHIPRCVAELARPEADLNDDCIVDELDLLVLADEWLLEEVAPADIAVISREAELHDGLFDPMKVYDGPSASGGQYIGTDDLGRSVNGEPVDGVAVYDFTIDTAGVYKILILASGPHSSSASFWIQIPDATSVSPGTNSNGWLRSNIAVLEGQWLWNDVSSNDHGDRTAEFTLPAGQHKLYIGYRFDGALIDRVIITDRVDVDERAVAPANLAGDLNGDGVVNEADQSIVDAAIGQVVLWPAE